MRLTAGTKLGPYEIQSALGAGGMGEVYRARDTKLNRDVALKTLPSEFALDADRLARFKREAQVLASLNHPHIAAIYGLEEANDSQFLVLELVEGETLADRLKSGPLAVDEALTVARQIAEALEAAHEKGIIHRDLKPANIAFSGEGQVKVLDFGLAKALDPAIGSQSDLTNSPTLTTPAMITGVGLILGTASYMSPEQAKGRNADPRSDVFSFGCVLYELLTGRQAFQGDEVSDVLASVLKSEPDLNLLPTNLNPEIHKLLRRCLEKNPKRRWHAAADLRIEIEMVLGDPRGLEKIQTPMRSAEPAWKIPAWVLAGAFLGVAAAGTAIWNLRPPVSTKITRFQFFLPEEQIFTPNLGRNLLDISPDGTTIVYVANQQLYLRRMADTQPRPIQGTDQNVSNPAFSPDGQWIAFWSGQDSTVKKIPTSGGASVTLCTTAGNPFGLSWAGDTIIFNAGSARGIFGVSANGGQPEVLVNLESNEITNSPQILPGGKALLFDISTTGSRDEKFDIVAYSRETHERKILIRGANYGRYSPTGHIVYAVGVNLLAVPFDVRRLQVTGGPVPVLEGVLRPGSNFSLSQDGTLVYVPASSAGATTVQRVLALAGRDGKVTPLGIPPGSYDFPRLSRDGTQLAVQTADDEGTIWIYTLSGSSSLRRLTFEGSNGFPVWSPDGRRVAFTSTREGKGSIFLQASDGTGAPERLTAAPLGELSGGPE